MTLTDEGTTRLLAAVYDQWSMDIESVFQVLFAKKSFSSYMTVGELRSALTFIDKPLYFAADEVAPFLRKRYDELCMQHLGRIVEPCDMLLVLDAFYRGWARGLYKSKKEALKKGKKTKKEVNKND